ncbi:MAG: hypothetical protein LBI35_07285 [Burkholderiales bacterium]|jgi:hypothetical protein|nr:hypothetical protein [Burkholderiales bacterium]
MPTPDYSPFDYGSPNLTQTWQEAIQGTNTNLFALLFAAVQFGFPGWNETPSYNGEKLTRIEYAASPMRVRIDIGYGTVGPSSGQPERETYSYSSDDGTTWQPLSDPARGAATGTLVYTYDSAGNITNAQWS